jgi:hypothetical protein
MARQRLLPALQNGLLGLLQGSPAQNQGVAEIQATQMPQLVQAALTLEVK